MDAANADLTHQDRTPVTLPKWVAQSVFDALTTSMDFASDFLCEEDVLALRAMAVILGVNPKDATPRKDQRKYCPGHEFGEWREWPGWAPPGGKPTTEQRECNHCDAMERR